MISNGGSKILITAMGLIFGFLMLMFLYYLWGEKFNHKARDYEKPLSELDQLKQLQQQQIQQQTQPQTTEITNTSDPDYVPTGFIKKPNSDPNKKQVFNISNNIYTYNQAEAVCKAFGAELATYPQLVKAFKDGADWCNYGWTKGQLALYPTQKSTWLKMQELEPERRNECGQVGINGGYFENPDLLYGVNCYGVKPSPRPHETVKYTVKSQKDYELEKEIAKIKRNIDNLSVLPFNESKWSNCQA